MATNYPTSLDTSSTTLRTDIASTDDLDASGKEHDLQTNNVNAAAIAVETKLGTGSADAASATAGHVLTHSSGGATAWAATGDDTTKLPLAGGTLSGAVVAADQIISRAVFKDYGETAVTNATSGATETLDLESGNVFDLTLDNNCTITLSNPPASGTSGSFTLILRQDGTGSRTVTWPASVDWASATAPTLTTDASAVDVLTFMTVDGGTIWLGFVAGQALG